MVPSSMIALAVLIEYSVSIISIWPFAVAPKRRKSQKKGDDNKNEKKFFKELGILIISICRFFYLKKATLLL
jgi:hypothetical protein